MPVAALLPLLVKLLPALGLAHLTPLAVAQMIGPSLAKAAIERVVPLAVDAITRAQPRCGCAAAAKAVLADPEWNALAARLSRRNDVG